MAWTSILKRLGALLISIFIGLELCVFEVSSQCMQIAFVKGVPSCLLSLSILQHRRLPCQASIIFRILDDDKNDEILIEEFINGTMTLAEQPEAFRSIWAEGSCSSGGCFGRKLKGHATKLEMITLMYDNTRPARGLTFILDGLLLAASIQPCVKHGVAGKA